MNIELLKEVKTPEETASIVYELLKAKEMVYIYIDWVNKI